jgi:ubiquitin C-terminal hydrolase
MGTTVHFWFVSTSRPMAIRLHVVDALELNSMFVISRDDTELPLLPSQTHEAQVIAAIRKHHPVVSTKQISGFGHMLVAKSEISSSRALLLPHGTSRGRGAMQVAAAQSANASKRLTSPLPNRATIPTPGFGGEARKYLSGVYRPSALRPPSPAQIVTQPPRYVSNQTANDALAAPISKLDKHVQKTSYVVERPSQLRRVVVDDDDDDVDIDIDDKPLVAANNNDDVFSFSTRPNRTVQPSMRTFLPRQAASTQSLLLDDKGGFRNLGNTCYMNAVLQALLSLKSFVERLQSAELKPLIAALKSKFRGVPQYADLFYEAFLDLHRKIHSGGSASYVSDLRRIKDAMARSNHRFASNAQQDAHEFLNECLTLLETDVENAYHPERLKSQLDKKEREEQVAKVASSTGGGKRVIDSSTSHSGGGDNNINKSIDNSRPKKARNVDDASSSEVADEVEADNGVAPQHACPVRDSFELQVTHVFTCIECGDVSTVNEVYRDVSIALPEGFEQDEFSLPALLDGFFAPDRFERLCKPPCTSRFVDVTHHISRLPPVLCLQLKRFKFGLDGTSDKLRHMVKTSARLDVAFCCADTVVAPGGPRDGVPIKVPARARRATPPLPPTEKPSPEKLVAVPARASPERASSTSDSGGVEVVRTTPAPSTTFVSPPPPDKRRRLAPTGAASDDDDSLLETLESKLKRAPAQRMPVIDVEPTPAPESRADKMVRKQREQVARVLKRRGIPYAADFSDLEQLAIDHNLFEEANGSGSAVAQSPALEEPAERDLAESPPPRVDPALLWPEPEQLWQATTTYTLHAVTYHHGRRASSGHYVTAVRKSKNKWTLFNDSSVRDESEDEALHSISNKREGYIYFFVHNTQLAASDADRI